MAVLTSFSWALWVLRSAEPGQPILMPLGHPDSAFFSSFRALSSQFLIRTSSFLKTGQKAMPTGARVTPVHTGRTDTFKRVAETGGA
jgi:hypothetical protein